ncbi:caspase domain-containing protein [Earliella scabrosa]|nr:caspase domain-containing protein [Earliella scabrosa]
MTAIIRRLTPRSLSQHQPATPARKPIRRALIIGINYEGQKDALRAAHEDARAWTKLCIDKYGFKESEITLMLDSHESVPSHLWPTGDNIRVQIGELVKGVQARDELVFFYSGHSGQKENGDSNEDDGRDEYIIPVDDDDTLPADNRTIILDDELRRILVDPLPVGSSLTAIFDSCHSGTLLDLDHYLCNNVWFPFMSRGERKPRTLWMAVKRKDGHDMRQYGVRVVKRTQRRATDGDNMRAPGTRADVKIHQWKRLLKEEMQSIETMLECLPGDAQAPGEHRFFEVVQRRCVLRTLTMPLPGKEPLVRAQSFNSVVSSVKDFAFRSLNLKRCTSPEPMVKCTGKCERSGIPKARVFSLAACHDPEQTWEGPRGQTMTRTLIELLEKDPHPPYLELAQALGHKLHSIKKVVEAKNLTNMRKRRQGKKARAVYDVDEFIPQIGSQEPVTPVDRFMKPDITAQ